MASSVSSSIVRAPSPIRCSLARGPPDRDDLELAFRLLGAKDLLVELADARLRYLGHKRPALGNPPARNPVTEPRSQLLWARLFTLDQYDARERALVPSRVGHRHDRRLEHGRVGHESVLELDRRDP